MNRLNSIKRYGKIGILFFLFSLSVGYFTGLLFVNNTTSLNADGIEENYNGNFTEDESDEFDFNQEIKYKKSVREIITIIHEHVISFSLIFFCTGLLLYFCELHLKLKSFLIIEPFISTVITFGGIYLLWLDYSWMKYIIMISGSMLTITYCGQVLLIIRELFFVKKQS